MASSKMKIRTGDEVIVVAGKDRSTKGHMRRGKVISVVPGEDRVIVDGVNMIKKAVRQSQKVRQGGIIETPGPLHISNVMLVCPSCDAPTRVAIQRKDGRRARYCKKCQRAIDD